MKRRTLITALSAGWASTLLSTGVAQETECGEGTPSNAEGPFYRPSAPGVSSLNPNGRLHLSGRVLDSRCRPVRNGVIEVWQANEEGEYDLLGYRNRGIVRCDENGHFGFRTVRPGHYLNGRRYRPAHIHVKVHADGRPTLTTQLYFPQDPYNDNDPWFRESLTLGFRRGRSCGEPRNRAQRGFFDFVV